MFYKIPTNKIEKLEKLVKRIKNKGVPVIYERGEETIENGVLYINNPYNHTQTRLPIKVKCVSVNVEGVYVVNGWAFVGTIVFTPNGNIIRLANSAYEGKIPSKYYSCDSYCEHCKTHRMRKDTYLIYNDKTKEFKQVGSNCLLDYTQGLDAGKCADMLACLEEFENCGEDYVCDDGFFDGGSDCYGLDKSETLKHAYTLVKTYGYEKDKTSTMLNEYMFKMCDQSTWEERYEKLTLASDQEIDAMNEWVDGLVIRDYDYFYTAKLTWLKDLIEWRDINLICSFISVYLKDLARRMANAKKTCVHVGAIGQRIEINMASVRVLYTRNTYYTYYGETTYTHEIIDKAGNIYIWKTSECLLVPYCEGDIERDIKKDLANGVKITLKATIKDHTEYKGVKQNVITRGKIIYD